MEAQVGWGAAVILMALMAAHAAEEIVAAGRLSCMRGGSAAMRIKAWLGDRIGPLLLLVALALAGVLVHAFWIWLALGIIAADLAQHAARSIGVRAYTPGVATGAFLAVYVLSFIGGSCRAIVGLALVVGRAGDRHRLRRGRLSERAAQAAVPNRSGRPASRSRRKRPAGGAVTTERLPGLQLLRPRHRSVGRAGRWQPQVVDIRDRPRAGYARAWHRGPRPWRR